MIKRYFWVFILLSIAGCAAPLKDQFAELDKKPICCKSLVEFEYKPLEVGKESYLDITGVDPVFVFGNIKSHFEAFSLPSMEDNYIFVKSYFNGMFIGQYLDPVFLVLNENYEPIQAFSLRLKFREGNLFGDTSAHLFGAAKLKAESKYLIVFAGGYEIEAPVAKTKDSTSLVMIGNTAYASPNPGKSFKLEKSPTGSLKLQIKKLTRHPSGR